MKHANGAAPRDNHAPPATERDRLRLLYEVTRRLAAAADTDEILRLIVHEAAGVLGVDAAGLRLLEGDSLVVRAHTPSARTLMSRTLKVGESLSGLAVATDQPVVVEDLVSDTRHDPAHRQAAIDLGYRGIVALPLRARGKRLGVLSLFTRRRQRLRPDALSTLLAFADHAAMAIEKDRLLHSAQVRADRLAALARLNQALTASLDVPDVLESVSHAAAELMSGAHAAGFWIADEPGGTLTLGAFSSDRGGDDLPQRVVPFGAGIVGWVARHRRPLNVADIGAFRSTVSSDWFAGSSDWFTSHGLRSALVAPVLFRDALMGALALFGDAPFVLEADDQHFLDNFAAQVGVAIRNARLYEELRVQRERLERRTAELDLLNRMGELLQASGTEEEAYDVFASFVGRFFPAENTVIAAINPSRNLLEVRSVSSAFSRHGEDVFAPDDCWALRRGRAHLVEISSPAACKHLSASAVKRAFCIPLMAQGEAIGLLSFVQDGPASHAGWDEDHQRLAVTVADHLGLAIANLKLRATLRNQSIRDPLTGLFNRRYMEETLERELARAERTGRPAAVVMLDLDHFKEFNDTFGHEAGDLLLREFGRLLRSGTRKSDLTCRYGGEEFVLVFPDMDADHARERLERLREALRELALPVRGQSTGSVTFSAGIAVYPEHGKDQADLLLASDRALYRAKRAGRDQIALAE